MTREGQAGRYRGDTPHKIPPETDMLSPRILALRESLLSANDALTRRRACDIPEVTIDRLVAIGWLRWNAGSLRLTETGEATLVDVQASLLCLAQAA